MQVDNRGKPWFGPSPAFRLWISRDSRFIALPFGTTRAMDCHAPDRAQKGHIMTNTEVDTNQAAATVAPQGAHVAPERPSSKKGASPKKSAPKGHKAANGAKSRTPGRKAANKGAKAARRTKKAEVRQGSKTAKILELLERPGGATAKELMKATGWQPHSVRGFLSGTIGKKMRMAVTSTKGADGERSYVVKN
jgi:hypothetical protein